MISVNNVIKTYKIVQKEKGLLGSFKSLFIHKSIKKTAVNNISFNIRKGEIVGYIGANGAGKSTTIKMMTGILTPDSGEILVNGITPYKNRKKNAKNIGVVFGQRSQLSWDVPVRESFYLLGKIYNIERNIYEKTIDYLTDILDLNDLLSLPIRQMSLGQKMRCELAAAFLHSPSVVYLDEPTIGLDVNVKDKIRKFIRDINEKFNTTIVLTTHDMQDIEALCNRIIIIDNGSVIYDGSVDNLKKYSNEKTIVFDCYTYSDKLNIEKSNNFIDIKYEKNKLYITFDAHKISSMEVIEDTIHKIKVNEISVLEPTIESIVQKIYRKEITV